MPKHRHTSLIFYLILAVSTAGLITYLSSQIAPESNDLSKSFTKWIMDLFVSGYSSETLQHYNGIARKAAHFTLYFLLGFSLIGVLQHQQRAPKLPTAVFLGAMFAGNASVLFYSLSGGLLSLCALLLLRRVTTQGQLWICAVFAAIAHNAGQIAAAMLILRSRAVLAYFPLLALSGAVTGLFTGLCAQFLASRRLK